MVKRFLTILIMCLMLIGSECIPCASSEGGGDSIEDELLLYRANRNRIYEFLIEELGLNHAAVCGIIANIHVESRFNPRALGDWGTSYGICQWHNKRFARLISWSEKFLPFRQGGLDLAVNEYSISHPGLGPSGTRYWAAAKKAGLKADAKLQVNTCWEICAVPYLPAMDLVAEHAYNLSTSVVDGVMLSWSLGGYPGPNLALFSRFRRGANDSGAILDGLAADLYGTEARDAVRAAWRAYSEAYRNYPMQWQTVYYSPVQMGPANLLYAEKTGWAATMVNTPYDAIDQWTEGYAKNRAVWVEQMGRTADGFDAADRFWAEAVRAMSGRRRAVGERDAGVFRNLEPSIAASKNGIRKD